jgi:hypothetical protein
VGGLYIPQSAAFHGANVLLLLMVPAAFAGVGAYPPRTGYWLPALLDRGTRIADRHPGMRRRRLRLGIAAAVVVLAALVPSWVGHAWPAPWQGATGADSAALRAIAAHRQALLRGQVGQACRIVDSTMPERTPCARWGRLEEAAAKKLDDQGHRAARGRPLFDDTPLSAIELRHINGGTHGDRFYTLSVPSPNLAAERRGFGLMLVRHDGTVKIAIVNGPAVTLKRFWRQSQRSYEVRQVNGESRIRISTLCSGSDHTVEGVTGQHCESAAAIAPDQVTRLLGAP